MVHWQPSPWLLEMLFPVAPAPDLSVAAAVAAVAAVALLRLLRLQDDHGRGGGRLGRATRRIPAITVAIGALCSLTCWLWLVITTGALWSLVPWLWLVIATGALWSLVPWLRLVIAIVALRSLVPWLLLAIVPLRSLVPWLLLAIVPLRSLVPWLLLAIGRRGHQTKSCLAAGWGRILKMRGVRPIRIPGTSLRQSPARHWWDGAWIGPRAGWSSRIRGSRRATTSQSRCRTGRTNRVGRVNRADSLAGSSRSRRSRRSRPVARHRSWKSSGIRPG